MDNAPEINRTPPRNLEAEQAVLGRPSWLKMRLLKPWSMSNQKISIRGLTRFYFQQ